MASAAPVPSAAAATNPPQYTPYVSVDEEICQMCNYAGVPIEQWDEALSLVLQDMQKTCPKANHNWKAWRQELRAFGKIFGINKEFPGIEPKIIGAGGSGASSTDPRPAPGRRARAAMASALRSTASYFCGWSTQGGIFAPGTSNQLAPEFGFSAWTNTGVSNNLPFLSSFVAPVPPTRSPGTAPHHSVSALTNPHPSLNDTTSNQSINPTNPAIAPYPITGGLPRPYPVLTSVQCAVRERQTKCQRLKAKRKAEARQRAVLWANDVRARNIGKPLLPLINDLPQYSHIASFTTPNPKNSFAGKHNQHLKRVQCHFKVLLRYQKYNGKFVVWAEPKKSTHIDNPRILGLCADAVAFFKCWDSRQRITKRNVPLKDHYDAWRPRHSGTQTSIYRLSVGKSENTQGGNWKHDGTVVDGKKIYDKKGNKRRGAVDAHERDDWSLFAKLEELCRSDSEDDESEYGKGSDMAMSGVERGSFAEPARRTAHQISKKGAVENDADGRENFESDIAPIPRPSGSLTRSSKISQEQLPSSDEEESDEEGPSTPAGVIENDLLSIDNDLSEEEGEITSSPLSPSKITDPMQYKNKTMIYDTITKKSMLLSQYEALIKQRTLDEAIITAKIDRMKNNSVSDEVRKSIEPVEPGMEKDDIDVSRRKRSREDYEEEDIYRRGKRGFRSRSRSRSRERDSPRPGDRDYESRKRARFDDGEYYYDDRRGSYARPEEGNGRKRGYHQYYEDRDYVRRALEEDHHRKRIRDQYSKDLDYDHRDPEERNIRKRIYDQYNSNLNQNPRHPEEVDEYPRKRSRYQYPPPRARPRPYNHDCGYSARFDGLPKPDIYDEPEYDPW